MQEWLTVIVVLLIVGILLDGWRRMRGARRDNIRVSRQAKRSATRRPSNDDHLYTSELPNGGARPAQRSGAKHPDDEGGEERQIPEQVALNLDESVPMLMDVEGQSEPEAPAREPQPEPEPDTSDDGRIEPSLGDEMPEPEAHEPEPKAPPREPDEVIIINVMAPEEQLYVGEALLDVLIECGMRYGDMSIFHRHTRPGGDGPVIFSLANMVKPGTFDLDDMSSFQTPGVSLFLTLPIEADSLEAFDIMKDTAQTLVDKLGGELKDENRSVMTRQTMTHCRQRISEYERKRRLAGA